MRLLEAALVAPSVTLWAPPGLMSSTVGRMFGVDQHQVGVVGIGGHAAEPDELRRIELDLWVALDRELRGRALELGKDRAVAFGGVVDAVGGEEPAAAGRVLHVGERISRDEGDKVLASKPRR